MIRIPLPRYDHALPKYPYLALIIKDGDLGVWIELHNGEEVLEARIDLHALGNIAHQFNRALSGILAAQRSAP